MKLSITLFTLFLSGTLSRVTADLVLNKKMMKLSKIAAELSALAYKEDPPGEEYDTFGFYDDEPDQALIAKKMGYCFAAFRGTTLTYDDWLQNIQFGKQDICTDIDGNDTSSSEECCTTRSGFYDAYMTKYKDELEQALRECAADCVNRDECVIMTGHSQGGAVAAVAALVMADLNPYVITFGQPPTIDAPCSLISSERWYRYINTKESERFTIGIVYDPVPFAPGLGADDFGHMILLSQDNTGVAYVGLDAQDFFGPLNVKGFEAHSMIAPENSTYPGYLDRIEVIMMQYVNGTYPVRTSGYIAGSLCTENQECESRVCEKETWASYSRCVGTACKKDSECDSDRCDSGICLPKLGSCMECDEDSDCAGGRCLHFKCSGESGLMDDNCDCNFNSDCASGRCEGFLPPVCEAQLANGAYCNEDSDCLSGECSWGFHCKPKSRGFAAVEESVEETVVELEKETGLKRWEIITIAVVSGILLVGVSTFGIHWIRRTRPRRQGYEAVPSLDV